MSTRRPFDLVQHLYQSTAHALQATPPGATVEPRTLICALVAIAVDFARALHVDPVAVLASLMPHPSEASVKDEERAVAEVRRCYAAVRAALLSAHLEPPPTPPAPRTAAATRARTAGRLTRHP